jgi:hypothetical protein
VTFPDLDDEPRRGIPTATVDLRALRDMVALLLVLAGLVGVVLCAFRTDALLGWAVVSALAVAGGLLLARGE